MLCKTKINNKIKINKINTQDESIEKMRSFISKDMIKELLIKNKIK